MPPASGAESGQGGTDGVQAYVERTMDGLEDYARREPWRFAAWVFGVGFVLGWKLKPW